ncbi:MAG: two component transcriptional regulator, winged helix family [Caulobacter sp.]|nr:two component transcriptional regulator, winged helix family [Caulobacter sp.]
MRQKLLVVDKDPKARMAIEALFSRHGWLVETAASGAEMDRALANIEFDVIILDVMLPDQLGLGVCARLSRRRPAPNLIVVSALADESDVVAGLEMGADDYVAKPIRSRELLARVRALLRRRLQTPPPGEVTAASAYRFAGWRLHAQRRQVIDPQGQTLALSPAEFMVFCGLVARPQQVLSREDLAQPPGTAHPPITPAHVNCVMSRLRAKLGRIEGGASLIRTIRHEGYLFTLPVDCVSAS